MTQDAEEPRRERRPCDLQTKAQVRAWLEDPLNHVRTALYVIKWDGATPYISIAPKNRLLEVDESFLEAILYEHRRRKTRPQSDDTNTAIPEET